MNAALSRSIAPFCSKDIPRAAGGTSLASTDERHKFSSSAGFAPCCDRSCPFLAGELLPTMCFRMAGLGAAPVRGIEAGFANRWTSDVRRNGFYLSSWGWPLPARQPCSSPRLTSLDRAAAGARDRRVGIDGARHARQRRRFCVRDVRPAPPTAPPRPPASSSCLRTTAITMWLSPVIARRRGQGRTSLRVETARLVQIDSQGFSGGTPFAVALGGAPPGRLQDGGSACAEEAPFGAAWRRRRDLR